MAAQSIDFTVLVLIFVLTPSCIQYPLSSTLWGHRRERNELILEDFMGTGREDS